MIYTLRILRILTVMVCLFLILQFMVLSNMTGRLKSNLLEKNPKERIRITVFRIINGWHGVNEYASEVNVLIIPHKPELKIERLNENVQIQKDRILRPNESLETYYFLIHPWNTAKITLKNIGIVNNSNVLQVECSYEEEPFFPKGVAIIALLLFFLFKINKSIKFIQNNKSDSP